MVAVKNRKIVRVVRQANTQPAKKTRAATVQPVKVEVKDEPRGSSLIGKKRQPPQKLAEVQPSPKAKKAKKVAEDKRVKVEVKTEVKSEKDSNYRPSSQPPAKKPPKKPTEFKVGKWNPNTEIVETEVEKLDDSDNVQFNCCLKCNARNVIRAVFTRNKFLLRKVMYDHKNIPSLDFPWSK